MVTSSDNWFRPSDVCVAPDGSVMVADWYDPGVGGHGMGDFTRGRIYRITPKGHKGYKIPEVDLESEKGLTDALASPNLTVRFMAMEKIRTVSDAVKEAIKKGLDALRDPLPKEAVPVLACLKKAAAQDEIPALRARALWQLAVLKGGVHREFHNPFVESVGRALKGHDPRFQILALRIAKRYDFLKAFRLDAIGLAGDASVRREILLLLRDLDPELYKSTIYELAKTYDGKDRFYLEAIGIAVGKYDKERRETILGDFEKHFPGWDDKIADLVWELRPPSVLPKLGDHLNDSRLTAAQRGRIVDILAGSPDKDAGLTLLKAWKTELPLEIQDKMLENMRLYLPTKWSGLRKTPELNDVIGRLFGKAERRAAALALIGYAEKTDAVDEVAKIAADAKEAEGVRRAAVQTLGALPSPDAVKALVGALESKERGLPAEAARSLAKLAANKPDSPGAVEALKALQEVMLDKERGAELQKFALSSLTATRPGTVWLLDLNEKGDLPADLKAETARLLRNSPYQDLRARVLIAFPPPGKIDPKKLPDIAKLVQRKGDALKGKRLFDASVNTDMACMKCHTVRGVGGAVGPDLSVIGKKASRENLFESILYPSKAIADQYFTWVIETKKGLSLSGLIVEETPDHVILRDANGKDTKVDKKDVDTRQKSSKSLMPDDLIRYISEEELVDMVEYLFTLKTPVLRIDYWHIVGPFDNGTGDKGLDEAFPPEKGIDLKATYAGKSGKIGWRVVKPDAKGFVDLQAFFAGDSNNIVSYSYREIESPVDQEATVFLGTDDCGKLWLNGELVYTNRAHGAALPEKDAVKVKLKKGANKLLLKVNNGDGDHGFYFMVQAEQELKRVEEKK
jgi:putative heme-binding domain-containing protein